MSKKIKRQDLIAKYMGLAIDVASKAIDIDEVPVGCVILNKNDQLLSFAHNRTVEKKMCFMHAEMIALQKASKKNGDWRLEQCKMFITLEPCLMCLGAIINSRISQVYIGSVNEKFGAFTKFELNPSNVCQSELFFDVLPEESQKLLKLFFTKIRNNKSKVNTCKS